MTKNQAICDNHSAILISMFNYCNAQVFPDRAHRVIRKTVN